MKSEVKKPEGPPAGRVLGIFAKEPIPGQVKTRLAEQTSPAWAARVGAAFLFDAVERWSGFPARRVLAFAPSTADAYFSQVVQGRFELLPQGAGDLGDRMGRFFEIQLRNGAEAIVLIGTDSPTLPLDLVERAFEELGRTDVVLGPATDGGYYLVGCARRLPPIFEDIRWSNEHVLKETIARLRDPAWRVSVLPPWYDVDTLADWRMLRGHLAALQRAGVDPGLKYTLAIDE
jgi:rSAM/selenodomain-associated transferase 1